MKRKTIYILVILSCLFALVIILAISKSRRLNVNDSAVGDDEVSDHSLPLSVPISNPISLPDDNRSDSETQINPELERIIIDLPAPEDDWREVSFSVVEKGAVWMEPDGEVTLTASVQIPPNWILESINYREGAGMGGADCWDHIFKDETGKDILKIMPVCGSYADTKIDVGEKKQTIIGFDENVGVDSHDALIVRIEDDSIQRYGTYTVTDISELNIELDSSGELLFDSIINTITIRPEEGDLPIWAYVELLDPYEAGIADAIVNSMAVVENTLW